MKSLTHGGCVRPFDTRRQRCRSPPEPTTIAGLTNGDLRTQPLNEGMHLVTCQLDDFARFTDAQTHLRGATEDHADVTGELSRTENGDQKVAQARRANDLDLTSLQHKERHVGLAAFDQYFPASDGTNHSVGGNSRDLRRRSASET